MRLSSSLCAALAFLATLAGCEKAPLYVDGAWVRLSPNPASPSAAYFTIHGGPEDVTLRDVMSEAAVRVEIHNSEMANGMMRMTPVDHVDIAAGKELAFKPGGRHVMLWGINRAAIASGSLPLVLIFSNGDRIIVDAAIRKAGDSGPDGE